MLGSTLLANFFAPTNGLTAIVTFLILTGLFLLAITAAKRGDAVKAVIAFLEKELAIKPSSPTQSFIDTKYSIAFLYSAAVADIAGFVTQSLHSLNLLVALGSFFVALVISTIVAKRI